MNIGFMQGRLSPIIDGQIQCFPWPYWKEEFSLAEKIELKLMEWTLDFERLYENPLLVREGQDEINKLSKIRGVSIPSITCDCFMQRPFWKCDVEIKKSSIEDFINVITESLKIGANILVIPLVDNGSIIKVSDEDRLVDIIKENLKFIEKNKVKIAFESDFSPKKLATFIERFHSENIGINYDIGNSASMGYQADEEIKCYGPRIFNVHVKDRMLGGSTVALGRGNANFSLVFDLLGDIGFNGNYIMQTARSQHGRHVEDILLYKTMIENWISGAQNHGL